jgi:hypothetical protein
MNARRVLLLAVLAARTAGAQEVNLARLGGESKNRVTVRSGAEYGLVAGVGYSREVEGLGRMLLGADLTLPWARVDDGDWRLRLSALAPIVGSGRWRLAGTFAPTLRHTSNDLARMTGVGVDLGAVGGWYARGWFAALEAAADWEIATYVQNSDRYRRNVYAGARDGWYGKPGGNFRLGLQAGMSFSRFDVALRLGRLLDFKGHDPQLPYYGTIGLTTRF